MVEMDGDVEFEVVVDTRGERTVDLDREWNDTDGELT